MVPKSEREFIWIAETPRDPTIADIGQKWLMSNFEHEASKVDESEISHVGFILYDLKSWERIGENGKWEGRSPSKLEMQFEHKGGDRVVKKILQQVDFGLRVVRMPQLLDENDERSLIAALEGKA